MNKDTARDTERAAKAERDDHRWAVERLLELLRDEQFASARDRNRAVALLLGLPALYGIVALVRTEPGSDALPPLRVLTLVATVVAVVLWTDIARRAPPRDVPLDDLGLAAGARRPLERLASLRRGLEGRVQEARNAASRRAAAASRAWCVTALALLGLALLLTLAALG